MKKFFVLLAPFFLLALVIPATAGTSNVLIDNHKETPCISTETDSTTTNHHEPCRKEIKTNEKSALVTTSSLDITSDDHARSTNHKLKPKGDGIYGNPPRDFIETTPLAAGATAFYIPRGEGLTVLTDNGAKTIT